MKSNSALYILVLVFLALSCNERNTADLAPEYLYDVQNQKVIKSIINNKRATIAIIYGNDIALQNAADSLPMPKTGASYTVVTWKQKPMPHWYGTNMNGVIYSIETMKVNQIANEALTFDYDFQPVKGFTAGDIRPQKTQRVHFITSQRAAIFP